MGLAAVAVGASVGLRVVVSGWATVMAQFIFTTASFLHDGRPKMAGLGVSAIYQYEFTLWGQAPGWPGHQVMVPWSVPYRGIWGPLYAIDLVLTLSRPVGRPARLIQFG